MYNPMFSFFKRKSKYPSFRILWTFDKRDAFFIKNAEWGFLDNEQVFVTCPRSAAVIPLEEWAQLVFHYANGQMTVTEFVHFLADQYTDNIPGNLDHVIIYELLQLHDQGLIKFSKTTEPVPPEFEQPGLHG